MGRGYVAIGALACCGLLGCGGKTVGGEDSGSMSASDAGLGQDAGPTRVDASSRDAGEPPRDAGRRPAPSGDIPPGEVLFFEAFDDDAFGDRGWYSSPSGAIEIGDPVSGAGAFRCTWSVGANGCDDGKPARHRFEATPSAYMSFYVRFDNDWVGSGRSFHPHLFHFTTNVDGDWFGPANTHLTTYVEMPEGRPMIGLQDSQNVDLSCVRRGNGQVVGCGGDFDSYPFSENRSVCTCNGLVGEVDLATCYMAGPDYWYSSRSWLSDVVTFRDEAGPYDRTEWHFVEAYFELNSIVDGVGVSDGKIRYAVDGELVISSDDILMRTAEHPEMLFDHILIAPYIGNGSPARQSLYIDELTVATGRPPER